MTLQTTGAINKVACRLPDIPQQGVNLAKRTIKALAESDNGRVNIEVIEAPDGSWLVFVNGGKREVLK